MELPSKRPVPLVFCFRLAGCWPIQCLDGSPLPYTGVQMKKFSAYRICSALAAIAALVVASGAGFKF